MWHYLGQSFEKIYLGEIKEKLYNRWVNTEDLRLIII